MTTKLEIFNQKQLKKEVPDIRPGDTVLVYQKIKEIPKKTKSSKDKEVKERTQIFEGVVLAKKHGKGISSTITVRKVVSGIGVERIFPIHSPTIKKIEIAKRGKVRRAKLYYLRKAKGRKARLKRRGVKEMITEEKLTEAKLEKEKQIKEEIKKTEEDKGEKEEDKK